MSSRLLLVYDPSDANSTAVASHYQSVRGVPAANLCPVSAPTTYDVFLADYNSRLRDPIRACLNNVGKKNVLYILLAYLRPLAIDDGTGANHAVDAYLSDPWDIYTTQSFTPVPTAVHRYYADSQSQGNSFVPFQKLADYRATARAQLIYSVWRLDGATPAVALAQIDNVHTAELAGGPPVSSIAGSKANACIDMTAAVTGLPDVGLTTANWDLSRVADMLRAANNLNVVQDTQGTSFGVSPSPNCPNTGLYAGWYNYGTYNDAFTWDAGSIGWDLDSGALVDPRAGAWWGAGAIAKGVSVTSGPITEPYLEGIARPAVIRNLLEGANVGDAFLRNTRWLKWRIVNIGDPLYQPFPNGVAPFNTSTAANAMTVISNQTTFRQWVGGAPLAVTISLANPAPAGGLTLALTANATGLNFPSTATVAAGQSSVTVTSTSSPVTSQADIQLTAASGSISATNTISLFPLLNGVALSSSSVKGGASLTGALALNGNAPLGGALVQLSSDQPGIASVPSSVTVSAGLVQAPLSISTAAVSAATTVHLTSTYAGAANTVTLTVTP